MVEFNAWLHDQGNHAGPDVSKPSLIEDFPVRGQGLDGGFATGYSELSYAIPRPTGDGHFCANHIYMPLIATHLLGSGTRGCCAVGDSLAGERALVIRTGHTGIEVNFLEAGAHVGLYSAHGFAHCLSRWQLCQEFSPR